MRQVPPAALQELPTDDDDEQLHAMMSVASTEGRRSCRIGGWYIRVKGAATTRVGSVRLAHLLRRHRTVQKRSQP